MARKYQHPQKHLQEIHEMLAQGMTHREIEKALGMEGDRPVHNLLKRERRKQQKQPVPAAEDSESPPALGECESEP